MGHINPAPILALTNNTSPGTPASSEAMDGAINAIVDAVNENYDAANNTATGFADHKNEAVLDHPDGSVTEPKIGDQQVTTPKLKDAGVTSVKIANRNVTREKIEIGGVGYQELDPSLTELIPNVAIQAKFQDLDAQLAEIAINVKTFGAKGDGVNDDTQAIKDAIAYAVDNNTNVYFPRGTYKVTSTISVPTGILLYGEGGWSQRTIISQSGDFDCFELFDGFRGGGLQGIHITGSGTNGASNTAIHVLRSGVVLDDISIGNYRGYGINMDGSIAEAKGSWYSTLTRIKIVGYVVEGTYHTERGIILGEHFNSASLKDFTIHYCKHGIETKVINGVSVSDGNLSENKDTGSYAIYMNGVATNVKFSSLHLEGNANGVRLPTGGDEIVFEDCINGGSNIQACFIDIPNGHTPRNVYLRNCTSFNTTVADVRVDNLKTYTLNIVGCSLRGSVPILNLNNSEIVITTNGVTTKDAQSILPLREAPTASTILSVSSMTTAVTLGAHDSGKTVVTNSNGVTLNITLPAYATGLRYRIVATRTNGVTVLSLARYQGLNDETAIIEDTIQMSGLGSIEIFSLSDRWAIITQKGPWIVTP